MTRSSATVVVVVAAVMMLPGCGVLTGTAPTTSKPGKWIVYSVNLSNGIHLAVAKLGGSVVRVLRRSARDSSAPDWSPVG